jgi:hypothetical protein
VAPPIQSHESSFKTIFTNFHEQVNPTDNPSFLSATLMRTLTSAHPAQLGYAKTMAWLIYLQHSILTSRNLVHTFAVPNASTITSYPNILPSVTAVGYEPFHYRSTSDHRGLFLDLDVTKLFGNATVALAAQPYRAIRSKDMKSNTKYIEAMTAHLTKNNFYTNMTLLQSARNDNLAERLDDLLGQASTLKSNVNPGSASGGRGS